jgi:hypothetical protein
MCLVVTVVRFDATDQVLEVTVVVIVDMMVVSPGKLVAFAVADQVLGCLHRLHCLRHLHCCHLPQQARRLSDLPSGTWSLNISLGELAKYIVTSRLIAERSLNWSGIAQR